MKKNLLALLAALCVPCAAFALPLTSADIVTLVQECPSLDQYKKTPAVIWNKKQLYTQDSRKRAVKTTSYVILCSAAAKFGWLQDQMIAPSGGEIELEQAAIFDPVTSKLIRNVAYDTGELAHGRIVLDLPPLEDDRIFVLSYRQIFPEPDVMEDLVWMSSEYPVWEGSVQVRIDKNRELLYESGNNALPTINFDNAFCRYGWFYFNQPAAHGVSGMVESSDPYVLFSLREGPDSEVAALNDLASRRWPSIPAHYVQKGEGISADLNTVDRFWRSASRLRSRGTWRSASMVPAEGPWTTWEAAYVAARWLEQRGWKAEVWFQHVVPQSKESLSCPAGFKSPALLLTEPHGKKAWYYLPGQPAEPGKIPVALRGKTLYAPGENRLRKRSIGGMRLEKNRLSMTWDLDVSADCVVSGTLDLRIRNGWVEQFEGLEDWDREHVLKLLDGLVGWIDFSQEPQLEPLGGQGLRVVLKVKARAGIQAPGGGMMVGLPRVTPAPLLRLHDVTSSSVLKFPFVVNQDYSVKLPAGYRLLGTPYRVGQNSAVSSYSSQYRLNLRKNALEGGEKLIQSGVRVDADFIDGFKRVLETWGTWGRENLTLVPSHR